VPLPGGPFTRTYSGNPPWGIKRGTPLATFFARAVQGVRAALVLPAPLADAVGKFRTRGEEVRRPDASDAQARKALALLEHAASLGSHDALFFLSELRLFPPSSHFPFLPAEAVDGFKAHAAATGNATSHARLGFLYATGRGGAVPVDAARAQLHYTLGAVGGDRSAQLALAHRHWEGVGTLRDCGRALEWYAAAAEACASPPFFLQLFLSLTSH
jgi:SEL1 protein